jgi:hypothetical protein
LRKRPSGCIADLSFRNCVVLFQLFDPLLSGFKIWRVFFGIFPSVEREQFYEARKMDYSMHFKTM